MTIKSYFEDVQKILGEIPAELTQDLADAIIEAYRNDKQLFMFGNGGSGSTASHFVNDFQKGGLLDGGKRFRAASFSDCIPLMLAWANDTEYANIFEPQVETWVSENDVVIGISGSGNSENVVRAMRKANELGAQTYGLTGMGGGKLAKIAKKSIIVPSDNMQKIEDVHTVILHCVYSVFRDTIIKK